MAAAMQRRKLLILENDRALRRELEAVFSDLDVTVCETSEQTLATATPRRLRRFSHGTIAELRSTTSSRLSPVVGTKMRSVFAMSLIATCGLI